MLYLSTYTSTPFLVNVAHNGVVKEYGKAIHNGQYSLLSLTGTGIVLVRESEELAIQLLI